MDPGDKVQRLLESSYVTSERVFSDVTTGVN